MPYDPSDARSALPGATATATPTGPGAAADHVKFYALPPVVTDGGTRTWYGRSQHLVIGYTDLAGETGFPLPGDSGEHADECAVLMPERSTTAFVTIGGETTEVPGCTLTFIPARAGTVRLSGSGRVITIFTARTAPPQARAANEESYERPHPAVAPLAAWPEPVGGPRLRTYDLDVPGLAEPPFRLFRCSTFMVNYIHPRTGPRDTTRMSPHFHDDFEQCSLVLEGDYVHHLRWPWTTDLSEWRADEHEPVGSPSLTIIPPPALHTSQATGEGVNHLIDIFSPPRMDFSKMDGWVLNAADYPMPEQPESGEAR
ncbi:hypothetical protein Aph01nite_24500 [Acrocarpospora phusangensis]|uniref:Uncharacterized protein n=1 Tax=Acrocarpospora phusangensis TaxID=1070424 RepID=A0A919UQ12_9ACTN|nr:hypothetical protein [Acrocarpospora phusangensis]GIH24140.1 hypothetical protein Aph01nite_24500 [Acrocarpospora phusangensis]